MPWPSLLLCRTHIDSFRQGLCETLGTPVSKKFRSRKSVSFIFAHASVKIEPETAATKTCVVEAKSVSRKNGCDVTVSDQNVAKQNICFFRNLLERWNNRFGKPGLVE